MNSAKKRGKHETRVYEIMCYSVIGPVLMLAFAMTAVFRIM